MKKKFMRYVGIRHDAEPCTQQGELILLKSILLSMDKSGRAPIDRVDKYFYEFYTQLNGADDDVNISWMELSLVKSAAYELLSQAGFISTDICYAGFIVSKKLVKKLSGSERKQLIWSIDNRLQVCEKLPNSPDTKTKSPASIMGEIEDLYWSVDSWEQEQRRLIATTDSITAQTLVGKLQRAQAWRAMLAGMRAEAYELLPRQAAEVQIPVEQPPIQQPTIIEAPPAQPLVADISLVSATICGESLAVNSWRELLVKVCEFAVIHRPYHVAGFDGNESLNSSYKVFSYIQSDLREPMQLANGLYVETDNSGMETIRICKAIMELCGYNDTELVIEYR